MPRSSNILDVLIASPSDVVQERDILTQVILDWNSAHSRTAGVTLSAIRWEMNAIPGAGDRPQELLNKQLVQDADIVIGIFWYRLGTPTGIAPSGTVEEIEIMRQKKKHVLLYFSEAPIPHDYDHEQFNALKTYRHSLQKNTLYSTFADREELRRLATKHLAQVVNDILQDVVSNSAKIGNRTGISPELEMRLDAVNVSARFTHHGADMFNFTLTNESSESVVVKEVRLFSIEKHPLTQPYILLANARKDLAPNGSLLVDARLKTNPAVALSTLNWKPDRGRVQTIPLDFIIEVGCEVLNKFKRYQTVVRAQLDLWNNKIDQVWF